MALRWNNYYCLLGSVIPWTFTANIFFTRKTDLINSPGDQASLDLSCQC